MTNSTDIQERETIARLQRVANGEDLSVVYAVVGAALHSDLALALRSNPQPGSEGEAVAWRFRYKAEHASKGFAGAWNYQESPVTNDEYFDIEPLYAASPTPPTAQPGEVERLREARDAVLALAASVVRGVAAEKRNQGEKQSALNYAARRIEDLRALAALTPSESQEAGT